MDFLVSPVKPGESFFGGSGITVRDKNLFKVHGRVNCMYFVSKMSGDKINPVYILLVLAAFNKDSVQVFIDVFLKFLKILFFNPSETVMNITEIQNFRYIIIQIPERADNLQGIYHFRMFGGQSVMLGGQFGGFLLDPSDSGDCLPGIHGPGRRFFRFFQLFVEAVDRIQRFLVGVDFQKRRQISHFCKL